VTEDRPAVVHDEPPTCPARDDRGPHLPRFPVTWLNQLRGHEYQCAYCGRGVTRDGQEPPA
jgi:hypothetical protein